MNPNTVLALKLTVSNNVAQESGLPFALAEQFAFQNASQLSANALCLGFRPFRQWSFPTAPFEPGKPIA